MNARLHATSPLGDADLVRADQAHYMHGYHVFDDHRVEVAVAGGVVDIGAVAGGDVQRAVDAV
ncbi:aspartate aminotransferase family protein, partial [Pseudomonas aeruginosa]